MGNHYVAEQKTAILQRQKCTCQERKHDIKYTVNSPDSVCKDDGKQLPLTLSISDFDLLGHHCQESATEFQRGSDKRLYF